MMAREVAWLVTNAEKGGTWGKKVAEEDDQCQFSGLEDWQKGLVDLE